MVRRSVFFLTLFFFAHTQSYGKPILVDSPEPTRISAEYIEIVDDPNGKFTFYDISNPEYQHRFVPLPNFQNFGKSNTYWLKIYIDKKIRDSLYLYNDNHDAKWDYLNLFYNSSTYIHTSHTGTLLPLGRRTISHADHLLRLPDSINRNFPIYIRLETNMSDYAPPADIEIKIESIENFEEKLKKKLYTQGIYLGIMIAMFLYNIFLLFTFRDRSYLLYVLFIASFALLWTAYFGTGLEFFWPDSVIWDKYSTFVLTISSGFIGTMLFSEYLQARKFSVFFYRIFWIITLGFFLSGVLPFFKLWNLATSMAAVLAIISSSTGILFTFILVKRLFRPAYYMLASWIVLWVGLISQSLAFLGAFEYNFFSSYGMEIGSTIEVIIISLGLGDRINSIKKEKEEAIQQAEITKQIAEKNSIELMYHEKEIELAQRIQGALIPSGQIMNNIFSRYFPAKKVGGDFYEIIIIDDHRTGILFCDVSGHGLSASMFTLVLKGMLTQVQVQLHEQNKELNGIVSDTQKFMLYINDILYKQMTDHNFISAVYAIYDSNKLSLYVSSAAHPPLIKLGRGSRFLINSPQGIPLGIKSSTRLSENMYQPTIHQFQKKEKVLFYSDGLTDMLDYTYTDYKDEAPFNNTSLESFFSKSTAEISAVDWLDSFSNDLILLNQKIVQEDDISLLLLDI